MPAHGSTYSQVDGFLTAIRFDSLHLIKIIASIRAHFRLYPSSITSIMSHHQVHAFYFRLSSCVLMILLGIAIFFTATYPPAFRTHGQHFNKTINYVGHDPSRHDGGTIAQIRYLPAGLKDGDSHLFALGVLASISFPGAYIAVSIAKAHDRGLFRLHNKLDIEELWFESRFFGIFLMVPTIIALIVGAWWSAVDEWSSSVVSKVWLEQVRPEDASNYTVPVIGATVQYGEYSFKQWTCQWAPILVGYEEHKDFSTACSRQVRGLKGVLLFLLQAKL
jgi:hypothetical protein